MVREKLANLDLHAYDRLLEIVQSCWHEIGQDTRFLRSLIDSLPSRYIEVIRNSGEATRY